VDGTYIHWLHEHAQGGAKMVLWRTTGMLAREPITTIDQKTRTFDLDGDICDNATGISIASLALAF